MRAGFLVPAVLLGLAAGIQLQERVLAPAPDPEGAFALGLMVEACAESNGVTHESCLDWVTGEARLVPGRRAADLPTDPGPFLPLARMVDAPDAGAS